MAVFSAVVHKEGTLYVADCPELGTVSQGESIEEAIANLKEASELFLEEHEAPSVREEIPQVMCGS
jgi:predicted RNase H-like HicB family nuclease